MQLQQALQKCDCVAQTLLLQTLEVPAAGEEFPSQMEINVFHGFFCAPTEGLALLLWLEKTRAWSRCKKTKMEGEIWWTPNGVIQNAIQTAFEFAIWMAQEMRAATSVCHPYSVGFSSRFLKPGCKQWVTERKEGYFWDFGSTEEKHETARNDREVRVLDDGKQHMGSRGEGDLASLLQYYIPAQLTLISGGQFISAGRIWLLGLKVKNEKLSISRAPMLVFAKCFLFSIPPCKSFFFF